MSRAFLTGSRRYGTPREDSDIDVVILCEEGDDTKGKDWLSGLLWGAKDPDSKTCKFGKLNLVTFCSENRFNDWKRVTEELEKRKPVTREEAVAAFQAAGFTGYGEDNHDNRGEGE